MASLGTFTRDNLISGDKKIVTESVRIASGTLLRGAVLGRVKVSVPTTGTAGSNTGDGTCTAVSGGKRTAKGTYTIKNIRVVAHGGEFTVNGPLGFVGSVLITAGAGGTGVFTSDQLNLTLTDGATDFAIGDSFTVAVTDGVPATGSAGSNTGNGTVTEVEGRRDLAVGVYTLICTAAVTHGGVFKLTDPSANVLSDDITIAPGAGGIIVYDGDQIKLKITDGSTDFIVGDSFTITVTIHPRQCVLLDKTATNGSSAPYAVLLEDTDASAAAQMAGAALEGQFNQRVLSFASGTDIEDVRDEMRDAGMIVTPSVAA